MPDKNQHVRRREAARDGYAGDLQRGFVPPADILEAREKMEIVLDLPGADEHSIHVSLENNILTVEADVKPDSPEEYELVHSEYTIGNFQRSFTVSNAIDPNHIEAHFRNGVLKLTLPKTGHSKPREIKVTTE